MCTVWMHTTCRPPTVFCAISSLRKMESKRQKEFNCTREWPTGDAIYETFFTGSLVFHQLALIVSAIFMCLSMGVSFWLILQHALHYLKPYEQKQYVSQLWQEYMG